jgi:hypothetical protein
MPGEKLLQTQVKLALLCFIEVESVIQLAGDKGWRIVVGKTEGAAARCQ